MSYNILLFDADETLFDFKLSEREAFKQAMLDFDIAYDETYHLPIYNTINVAIWKEFEQGLITQKVLKIERFKRLADALGLSFDPELFATTYMKHLADGSFLYDDATMLIEELSKSHRLAIITNGLTTVQSKRICQSSIAHHFETIVISESFGIAKPHAEIFKHTLDLLGATESDRVLMIGDSLSSDIQGGINAGIATCWYNPNNLANTTNILPTFEIQSLHELIHLAQSGSHQVKSS